MQSFRMNPADPLPPVLVVMALQQESQGVFEAAGVPVLYTGLGKVNAAIALTRQLARYNHQSRPLPLVVNFGTAGSHVHRKGSLLACHEFLQRDMDVSGLGFEVGVTPFEDTPALLKFEPVFGHLPAAICGSGDSFVTAQTGSEYTVVDMEAYALAKVCLLERGNFACVKYVTDGSDDDAGNDWQKNAHKAAESFLDLYRWLVSHQQY